MSENELNEPVLAPESTASHAATDQQLKDCANRNRTGKLLRFLSPVIILVTILTVRFDDIWNGMWLIKLIIIIAALFLPAFGRRMQRKSKAELDTAVAGSVVQEALDAVVEHARLNHNAGLPSDTYRTKMGFPFTFGDSRGSDLVHCTYRGVELRFCEALLTSTTEVSGEGSGGVSHKQTTVDFRGPWLTFKTENELAADVIVSDRHRLLAKARKATYKTGDESFDKQFCVTADSDAAAEMVLTPAMMGYLMNMTQNGDVYVRFFMDGSVYLAVNMLRQGFLSAPSMNADAQTLRTLFTDRLRWLTSLVDLMLDE